MTKPLLSIAIPTFNRDQFLLHNLNQLTHQIISQKLERSVEIIISDNASTDKTSSICKQLTSQHSFIKYYKNKQNLGYTKNALLAITKTKGNWFWLLGDDDYPSSKTIQHVINYINHSHPKLIILNSRSVATTINSRGIKMNRLTSLSVPGLKIQNKSTIRLTKFREYCNFLLFQGFFNRRLYMASPSLHIINKKTFESNIQLISNDGKYPQFEKNFYPFFYCLWYSFPNPPYIIDYQDCVSITLNNAGWNSEISKANQIVRNHFNPLIKLAIKKSSINLGYRLLFALIISLLFPYLVQLITIPLLIFKPPVKHLETDRKYL